MKNGRIWQGSEEEMITAWQIICESCMQNFSTAFPEEDCCPYCGKRAEESMQKEDL